ncbi:MAG: hypothetical protein ABI415_06925, partial [Flavitalea sp.]
LKTASDTSFFIRSRQIHAMEHNSHIHRKVEEVLASLDNISPASPLPFFYTRLEARLVKEESNIWERTSRFVCRPAIAFITVGLVLLLNTVALVKFSSDDSLSKDQQELATADEYNRTTSMYNYNIDNVQP